jgi:hypothetical protein
MTKFKNIAIAIASVLLFTGAAHAQTGKNSKSSSNTAAPGVKYLGNDGSYLIFEVSVDPAVPAGSVFAVADQTEGQLYSSRISSGGKVQSIKVERRNDQVLEFMLVTGSKTYSRTFSAGTNTVSAATVYQTDMTVL